MTIMPSKSWSRRIAATVVIHIQRVEERVKLPPKVRSEAVKLPGCSRSNSSLEMWMRYKRRTGIKVK